MCPQKYYILLDSKNGKFMLKNAKNDAHTDLIKADRKIITKNY
jgi:hypothetical protein